MTNPTPALGNAPPLYANQHFTVEPCTTCAIPGYLIVAPKIPAVSLSEINSDALAALGPTLALATRAIEAVIGPERVYCALFAEQTRHIHFHLFPRTAELTNQFLASHPEQTHISGPQLLDWARRAFQQSTSRNDDVINRIRAFFKNDVSNSTLPT